MSGTPETDTKPPETSVSPPGVPSPEAPPTITPLAKSPQPTPPPAPPTPPTVPETITRTNPRTNLLEVIDIHTGRVLCVQHSPQDLLGEKWDRLTRIDTPQGPVFIEKGINFDILRHSTGEPYSQVLSDLICERIVNGSTLIAACNELNLGYATICRWRRENEDFRKKLDDARKDRAEYLHDEMLTRARHSRTSARTHIEALQYAMERGDPGSYAPKAKVGDTQGSVTFIISTGIDRTQLPPTVDVTPTKSVVDDELPVIGVTGDR